MDLRGGEKLFFKKSGVFCRSVVAVNKIYHIHTRASEHFTFCRRQTLHIAQAMLHAGISLLFTSTAVLIVDFSSFALNEFLFFLPRFFKKLYEFRPDFRIGYFVTGGVMIDKISPVVSSHPNLTFFRNTA